MIIRDIQAVYYNIPTVYYDGLKIYHNSEELYDGDITNIPEELLVKEIIKLTANFNSRTECAWIEVYV